MVVPVYKSVFKLLIQAHRLHIASENNPNGRLVVDSNGRLVMRFLHDHYKGDVLLFSATSHVHSEHKPKK